MAVPTQLAVINRSDMHSDSIADLLHMLFNSRSKAGYNCRLISMTNYCFRLYFCIYFSISYKAGHSTHYLFRSYKHVALFACS